MMTFKVSNNFDRKQKNPIHFQKMGFPATLIHFFPPQRIIYILFYAFILIDTSIYKYRLKCQEINQRSPAERVY